MLMHKGFVEHDGEKIYYETVGRGPGAMAGAGRHDCGCSLKPD
jgi:hypothetical protein